MSRVRVCHIAHVPLTFKALFPLFVVVMPQEPRPPVLLLLLLLLSLQTREVTVSVLQVRGV